MKPEQQTTVFSYTDQRMIVGIIAFLLPLIVTFKAGVYFSGPVSDVCGQVI